MMAMKIIYKTATTLNGYIADENESLQWLFDVDHTGADNNEAFLRSVDVIVEGSHTYEWVLRETDVMNKPDRWETYFGMRPVFVFSSRSLPVPPGADVRFVKGPVRDLLPAIRGAAQDKNVWVVGGGELAGQFIDAQALDEIILTLAPVVLAGGAPLLPRRVASDHMSLSAIKQYGQFVELRYALRYLS
jgi:dihydrofolate reductase